MLPIQSNGGQRMMKHVIYVSLLILVSCIVLMGCSAETGNDGQNAETSEEPTEGGTLNFAFNAQPGTLDPHMTTSGATRDISRHLFETLVAFNSKYEVKPMLAESFEVKEDGKQITFHLREGVLFHNGKEMKAEDVIASMEKWQSQSSQARTFLADTEYVADDDYTVTAHIKTPGTIDLYTFADFAQYAAIMPKEVVEAADTEGVKDYIGTGPFKFEEWVQDQYIHFTKFEDYQSRSEPTDGLVGKKEALVDDLYFHIVPDASTRISGTQTGEYHIANHIPHDNVDQLENNTGATMHNALDMFPAMVFNKKKGFFTNQTARQAANAAINVEDILKAVYGGADFYTTSHAFMSEKQTEWYTDAGEEVYYTYDLDLAKQLLEEAGYDGEEIVIIATRDHADYYNIAVVLEQQLSDAGMNVRLDVSDDATTMARQHDEEAYDIYINGWHLRPHPLQYPFLHSSTEYPGWTNSETIDSLLDKINYSKTQEEAQQYTAELQEEIWQYLPLVKPGNRSIITAINNRVEGFENFHGPTLWNVSIIE